MIPPYVRNTNPQTQEDYEDAINEAEDQYDEIMGEIEDLQEIAGWWAKRGTVLWDECYEKFHSKPHPVGPGQTSIELNQDFFRRDELD